MKRKIKYYFLWLILINVLIFLIQVSFKGFTQIFVLNELALQGEYWRFVSSMFLHGGIVHLLYNLLALFMFGFPLEKVIGSKRFLFVYFSSGIIANIISVNFYPSSLGASGAIYGVMGALTILRPLMMVWTFGLIMPMFLAAILWTIGGLIGMIIPSNTGHIANLSGIGIGFILGVVFRFFVLKYKKRKGKKIKIPEPFIRGWENHYMR
jgi:membrane associated rhomboid family serine protease